MEKRLAILLTALNLAGFAALVTINYLANSLPIGGRTTGEVSAMFPVLVTPASYAFSIWGLIYLLLAGFIVIQLIPGRRNASLITMIGPWFFVSCLFNISWIFLWHYLYIVSAMFIMIGLLITLSVIYQRIRFYDMRIELLNKVERLGYLLPFSVYLAWISVASIVNISIGLEVLNWNRWGLSDEFWAVAGLALYFGSHYTDIAFMLVIIWALTAIGGQQSGIVSRTAYLLSAMLLVSAFIFLYCSHRVRLS
ncbi:tryptophan-rich sensory protein [Salipaludibacillus aurantiacus]|uniref:TspO/MBR family protein n=1 Tax=Salipaludibacillus aurantiacus TaxID=1601833 RepID=A0A1H9UN94_9BACI|nr:tryptophan-rich sensory protein [Salipaludibacillus aurantiacus]SES10751.1 TspO/MBR family protein [Salipaludibacillus aurantiacus]